MRQLSVVISSHQAVSSGYWAVTSSYWDIMRQLLVVISSY